MYSDFIGHEVLHSLLQISMSVKHSGTCVLMDDVKTYLVCFAVYVTKVMSWTWQAETAQVDIEFIFSTPLPSLKIKFWLNLTVIGLQIVSTLFMLTIYDTKPELVINYFLFKRNNYFFQECCNTANQNIFYQIVICFCVMVRLFEFLISVLCVKASL